MQPPKDLVALGKPQAKAAGMGLTLRSDNAGNRKPSSQVQAQARLRLQRLQAELKKEKALQASLLLLFQSPRQHDQSPSMVAGTDLAIMLFAAIVIERWQKWPVGPGAHRGEASVCLQLWYL